MASVLSRSAVPEFQPRTGPEPARCSSATMPAPRTGSTPAPHRGGLPTVDWTASTVASSLPVTGAPVAEGLFAGGGQGAPTQARDLPDAVFGISEHGSGPQAAKDDVDRHN